MEFLEETVLAHLAEMGDMREEIALKQNIIDNQKEQAKSLVLINQEHTAIQTTLAQENANLRSILTHSKQSQVLIFGTALAGAACLFVDNKVVNYVGVGLLGFSVYLTIR